MIDPAPEEAPSPDEMPSACDFMVVGLGASASGIQALRQFFAAVPADSGMAYIVILHPSPEHESSLAQVLQEATDVPVSQLRTRAKIEPGRIYLVGSDRNLSLAAGDIDLATRDDIGERRAPIDVFFRSLAEAQHARAAAVVLSGSGAGGSLGMKRIKECGGICIAQDPAEAEFPEMPGSAIASGLVDFVLPAAEIPPRLAAYRRRLQQERVRSDDVAGQEDQALADIFALLRARTAHDFTHYKRSTMRRRIERRMNVRELGSIGEYALHLRESREETPLLLRDLLISVTSFFRDPDAWAALGRDIVPRLLQDRDTKGPVRAWVAGCATGEEAYSLAMLLAEQTGASGASRGIQVFATDIDIAALAKARSGFYTPSEVAELSTERLKHFFVEEGDGYRVCRELREMVLFAAHNLVKDAPFSRLDLVSCRNLLIYLDRAAQSRVLRLFHFALEPGGLLFLGNSESVDDSGSLFARIHKEQRIFRSRNVVSAVTSAPAAPALPVAQPGPDEPALEPRQRMRLSYRALHQQLLEQHVPPSVLINQDHEILHLSENAGRYLRFVGGEPSQNLLRVVRPELRLELHGALYRAMHERANAEAIGMLPHADGRNEQVRIVVRPHLGTPDDSPAMILVLFETIAAPDTEEPATAVEPARQPLEPLARQLEEELMQLKLQLRSTIEQHELQQEELKSSNEELQAMNEELRSSGEELETSKEELQSLNEELTAVNQELKIKIDELSQANNDTRNLMDSTDIATVFVDPSLRIKLFTPRARALFNLIGSDAGRPLLDITHRLRYPQLAHDIDRCLATLSVGEREVESNEGRWYIARVLPYRTAEDRVVGAVLTFTDITERKRAEQALRASEERMRLVVESVPDYLILTLDPDGRIRSWNSGARETFGYTPQEALGNHFELLFSAADRVRGTADEELQRARESGRASDERWHVRKDGRRVFVSGVTAPLVSGGRLVGYTKIARDMTERMQYEDELREAREQLEARVSERTQQLAETNEVLRRQIEERMQAEEMRLRLLRQVVRAQEDERRRISRELHDQLGQQVTALGLRIAALKASPEIAPALRPQIEVLEDILKRLDNDVDFLVWELRPTGLDDLGLAEALSDYAARWSRYLGVPAALQCRLEARLPAEMETVLYRIVQEALNNVAKHAQATAVRIVLERHADHVSLSVEDNGVGFDASGPAGSSSLGLLGMRERAALVGGTVMVASGPGGTNVHVRVPLEAGAELRGTSVAEGESGYDGRCEQ